MNKEKNPFQRTIFVCCRSRDEGESCSPSGSNEGQKIRDWLKEYTHQKGLKSKVRIVQSGCFDLCSQGPNIFISPEHIWIKKIQLEDLPEIARTYIDTTS